MNLYIRLFLYLIKAAFRKKIDAMETSSLRFHVWPNDLDFNMHMNNGRYLTIMDLGRLDFMLCCGLFIKAMKKGYAPVLGSVKIRYRLPLMPFQAYDPKTKLISWDEKWIYMEQRFVISKGQKAGAVAAIALLKASLLDTKNKKTVPAPELLKMIGHDDLAPPPMPDYVLQWISAESALRDVTAQ